MAPNLEWAHITSPGRIGDEFAPEHFRPSPLPRGTSDAHPCRAAVMKTAQEDGMRMRSTVVGKLWARILLALVAGAITGFVSLHRAQSGAVQATPPDVAWAGSR